MCDFSIGNCFWFIYCHYNIRNLGIIYSLNRTLSIFCVVHTGFIWFRAHWKLKMVVVVLRVRSRWCYYCRHFKVVSSGNVATFQRLSKNEVSSCYCHYFKILITFIRILLFSCWGLESNYITESRDDDTAMFSLGKDVLKFIRWLTLKLNVENYQYYAFLVVNVLKQVIQKTEN